MRRFFSTLLYLAFGLPVTLAALLLLSIRPWVLDRDVYKRIVTDDRLYAALTAPEMASQAPDRIRRADTDFNGKALIGAIQKNLPVEELKALGTQAVDRSFGAIEGESGGKAGIAAGLPLGRLELDMRPLKKALRARTGAVARDYVAGLPSRPEPAAPGDFTYRPAGLAPAAAEATAVRALGRVVDSIPDIAADREARIEPPRRTDIARGTFSKAVLDRGAAVMSALSALLVGGLAALGGSTAGRRLARAGRFLLIPSILVLGVGALLAIPGSLILGNLMPEEARSLLGGAAGAQFRAYLASVLGVISRSFFVTGLIGTSLGGLLVSAKRIAEPKEI